MSIFDKRDNVKPYEYPDLIQYGKAIQKAYWIVDEFNFTSDIQDFKVNCSDYERGVIERTMLSIAQIEVNVKTFWGDIYKRMPKSEIGFTGSIFSESEARHFEAYSELLTQLGLDNKFQELEKVPEIQNRIKYLSKYLDGSRSKNNKMYTKALMLFSLFIEHVSLFSQFLIIQSFNKYKNLFPGFSNVVDATMQEENLHGDFGVRLVNIIREEHPDFFDQELEDIMLSACIKAYKAESDLVDWILGSEDLSFISRQEIKEFIKDRFNTSLTSCKFPKVFETNTDILEKTDWLTLQLNTSKEDDFFSKKVTSYFKYSKPITEDDLF